MRLVEALRQRAVVMWRTHADTMPDEAAALSVLALADLHDAAEQAGAPWTLLLDEFGAVIKMAAQRGVAILQRGRSHGGQVIVITQSAADIEALTQQPGLLASLTDNFAGVVAHRQTSPESRDWLAKLMGTRSLWQTTSQTGAHGTHAHGARQRPPRARVPHLLGHVRRAQPRRSGDLHAARRRARSRASILPVHLPQAEPERIDPAGPRTALRDSGAPRADAVDHTRRQTGTPLSPADRAETTGAIVIRRTQSYRQSRQPWPDPTTTLTAHRAQAPSANTRDASRRDASASEPDTDRSAHSSRRWPASHETSTPGARAPRAKQRPPARSRGVCTAATSS